MTIVKSGRSHTLPTELERIRSEITPLSSQWERSLYFALLGYEEAITVLCHSTGCIGVSEK
jgi:hypothetical protein